MSLPMADLPLDEQAFVGRSTFGGNR